MDNYRLINGYLIRIGDPVYRIHQHSGLLSEFIYWVEEFLGNTVVLSEDYCGGMFIEVPYSQILPVLGFSSEV